MSRWGWDWVVTASVGVLMLQAGSIRTNVMLVDAQGADLGEEATSQQFAAYLGTWDWQAAVLEHLKATPNAG